MIYFSAFYWGKNFTFSILRIAFCTLCECECSCAVGCFRFYPSSSFLVRRNSNRFASPIRYVCQWILSDFDGIEGYRSTTAKVRRNFTLYGHFVAFFLPCAAFFVCVKFLRQFEKWNNGERVKCSRRFCATRVWRAMWYAVRPEKKKGGKKGEFPNYPIPRPKITQCKVHRSFCFSFPCRFGCFVRLTSS